MNADQLRALFPNASDDLIMRTLATGAAVPAPARKPNRAEARREVAELHKPFMQWLGSHGIEYIRARSDKAATIEKGWPDFTCLFGNRVALVEMKWPGEKLSEDQEYVHARLKRAGVPVITATSFEEARVFVMGELGIK